jgi:hypothetical protein
MDGNYSKLMPQRLERATGVIVLDSYRWFRFWRYVRRTLTSGARAGGLPGNRDSVKWEMVHWVLKSHGGKYQRSAEASGLPFIVCRNARELNRLYKAWGLELPANRLAATASAAHSG